MVAADLLPEGEVKSERKNIYVYKYIYICRMCIWMFLGGDDRQDIGALKQVFHGFSSRKS